MIELLNFLQKFAASFCNNRAFDQESLKKEGKDGFLVTVRSGINAHFTSANNQWFRGFYGN